MRKFSFGIHKSTTLSQPGERSQEAPSASAHQRQNLLRRRLEDLVEDLFYAALKRGDLASAEDLLGVMENMQARARVRLQAVRKGTALMIARARDELELRKARRRPVRAAAGPAAA